ncbi:MAG: gliding motility-associated C-terminal domain-containing protein [Lewinellaceae bacterium]|nr:gliding motility-associated C-terminal domain-containing protein [Saprospiraceae bacterium]MCB9333555.1 gliding motility-associated C-terminal domain-containing protein [Lewinellaceae bacterium]
MNNRLRILLLLTLALSPLALFATHNRAGEIHVEQIGPLTVRATIITWTRTLSFSADRDTLTIDWGDGKREQVVRSNGNGNGVPLSDQVKYNTYIATHTYAGPAWYKISMTDPNRTVGIINVNPPQSENVPFYIETIYKFLDPQFDGTNTTPFLLQPPIDNACVGQPFKHNPNAFDPDLDSISYKLITPLQAMGAVVPNYSFPNEISPGPNNTLFLNERTGDILWQSPQIAGEYNLAFIVISWRKGVPIDTTIRDMQIFVENCQNRPPVVSSLNDLCVIAGNTLEFEVTATDPDSGNLVLLTATGGPISNPYSPATFVAPTDYQVPPVSGTFRWQTACEHVSNQPYTVVFKAVDTLNKNTPKLADLKTVNIKVVGPPPEDVQAVASFGQVEITWEKPYVCEDADQDYFYGFSVWRRLGTNPFLIDTCTPGLKGKGYTELIFVTRQEQNGRYYFKDTNVERGRTYCYRILAKYARTSAGGYPYNLVESLPSEEACAQLPRELPLITNVSVRETDGANGQMDVCWSKPVAKDLDTLINHGPYRYRLLRAPGLSGGTMQPVPGATFTVDNFWQANDTCFTDQNLNTTGQPYHYKVEFYTRGNFTTPLGSTNDASSVFLTVNSTDNTNLLSWEATVPWTNTGYTIFRLNDNTGLFDSIGFTTEPMYDDRGLENGKEYCYYVRSTGTYSVNGVIDPILNNSQKACGIPLDTVPPCVPMLTVTNICNGGSGAQPDPPYENTLSWTNPNTACPGTDDAVKYHLWYADTEGEPLALFQVIDGAENTSFVHVIEEGLAGCYAVSAVDSTGNESPMSVPECVDNCPNYTLPNAFTPNGDGFNDLFTPFPDWRFVERIDMQIFNRWGNVVFEATDPEINWNGRNISGNEVSEGTYFYVCKVYERRVDGVVLRPDVLSGYIELVRGGK